MNTPPAEPQKESKKIRIDSKICNCESCKAGRYTKGRIGKWQRGNK